MNPRPTHAVSGSAGRSPAQTSSSVALLLLCCTSAACGKATPASGAGSVETALAQPAGASPVATKASLAPCKTYAEPTAAGVLADPDLDEVSGIAASLQHPGILWAHNDGGKPKLYALDSKGAKVATYKMKSVPTDDWEDLALGPCSREAVLAGTACLYVADTGDNGLNRRVSHIVRTAEPATLPGPTEDRSISLAASQIEVFPFTFPDGPQDVEAMTVLPDTRVLLFSKRDDGRSHVYRLTLGQGAAAQAERLGTLATRAPSVDSGTALRVTAADLTPDGRWLLLRTYARVFAFDLGAALVAPVAQAEAALTAAVPTVLKAAAENQGESVAWDPNGGYWHVSEGAGATLFHVGCSPAP